MTKVGSGILSRGQDVLKNKPKRTQKNKERQRTARESARGCQQDLGVGLGAGGGRSEDGVGGVRRPGSGQGGRVTPDDPPQQPDSRLLLLPHPSFLEPLFYVFSYFK